MEKGKKLNREWIHGNKMDGYAIVKKSKGKTVVYVAQRWLNGKIPRGGYWGYLSRAKALGAIHTIKKEQQSLHGLSA